MKRRSRLHTQGLPLRALTVGCLLGAGVTAGCASVPGETLASGSLQRDISHRVLGQASTTSPACRNQRIVDTDVLELHPDGKVAAERWTVEQCGRRLHYHVTFPANGKASAVLVRPE